MFERGRRQFSRRKGSTPQARHVRTSTFLQWIGIATARPGPSRTARWHISPSSDRRCRADRVWNCRMLLCTSRSELEALLSAPAPSSSTPTARAPKRRALPAELPRIETRHEADSCDSVTCGASLVSIGEYLSEKLDCKPLWERRQPRCFSLQDNQEHHGYRRSHQKSDALCRINSNRRRP